MLQAHIPMLNTTWTNNVTNAAGRSGTPDRARDSPCTTVETTCSSTSQQPSQARARPLPRIPFCGRICQTCAYMRMTARAKLDAETTVMSRPTSPILSARCVSTGTAATRLDDSPVTASNRSRPWCSASGRYAASTTTRGTRAKRACAAITTARSTNSTRSSSSTVRRTGGTVSRIR